MPIAKRRIRLELESGQHTYWLTDEEFNRYGVGDKAKAIRSVIIEQTMSYKEAIKYLAPPVAISKALDDAVISELANGPKSILGMEK